MRTGRVLRTAICAALTTTLATSLHAADLGSPGTWTTQASNYGSMFAGFYAGANLGFSFGSGTTTTTDATGVTTSNGAYQWATTPSYAAFAGYNVVSGNFLYGLEGELMRGSLGGGALPGFTGFNTDVDYQATLRARLGILLGPNLLLYGKIGGSYASMTFTDTASNTASSTFYGYTVGLGAEYKVTEHLGLRLDYDYNAFNSAQVTLPAGTNTFQPAYHQVRLGFSYRF